MLCLVFRQFIPTFRKITNTLPSRSNNQRRGHIARTEILRLSVVRVSNLSICLSISLSLSLSLSLSPPPLKYGLQHPQSCSAPRHIGCSSRSYTARSETRSSPHRSPLFYMTLIQYHSDHTDQVRVEKCATKCGNSSPFRHFL